MVPLMSVFEPLFLLLVLVTGFTLVTALAFLVRGKFARAVRIGRRLAVGATIYFAIVIAVSLVTPRREFRVGDTQCFDDWCIAVVEAHRAESPPAASYDVTLRLSNRARRMPMGEKGTVVYLTDAQGRRYNPQPDEAMVPFDTQLQPGTSVIARRRFDVARDARDVGLVYTHEGGFPIGWLIVGEGGWFSQPPIVRLQ
jgi:hypothetical protein